MRTLASKKLFSSPGTKCYSDMFSFSSTRVILFQTFLFSEKVVYFCKNLCYHRLFLGIYFVKTCFALPFYITYYNIFIVSYISLTLKCPRHAKFYKKFWKLEFRSHLGLVQRIDQKLSVVAMVTLFFILYHIWCTGH